MKVMTQRHLPITIYSPHKIQPSYMIQFLYDTSQQWQGKGSIDTLIY